MTTEQFVIDMDTATSRIRRVTYRGVELPVETGGLSVEVSYKDTTLTLVFKGDWNLVHWMDSERDNTVDADPAHRLLEKGEDTQP